MREAVAAACETTKHRPLRRQPTSDVSRPKPLTGGLERVTLLGLMLVGLTGCTTDDQSPASEQPCPSAAIVEDAARLAVPPPDVSEAPQDLRYVAALSDIRSACAYTDEGVEVDLGFNVVAERGPALEDDAISLSYFVAAVGPGDRIVSKETLGAELEFPEGQQIAGVAETMTLRLPISEPAEAAALRLYVGFQLDPAALRPPPPLLR